MYMTRMKYEDIQEITIYIFKLRKNIEKNSNGIFVK